MELIEEENEKQKEMDDINERNEQIKKFEAEQALLKQGEEERLRSMAFKN